MIAHAHALAEQGKAVYIIAVNRHDANRIRRLVGTPTRGIKVETEESLPNFDWRTMQLKRAWPNCVVLVDHFAIEGRIKAQVEMMTRYDQTNTATAGVKSIHLDDYDPTLWCNICGAATSKQCHCPPISKDD